MQRRSFLGTLTSLLIGSLIASPQLAQAQAAWPTKAITMVVPFPPGGLADLVARPVAEALSRELGQPVVIENKAGAGGGIGMAQAAKAKADGYTMLMALSSLTVIPEADAVRGCTPMFNLPELRPPARYTADAKKRPGAINYGSSGNYGTMHVPMEMLAQNTGTQMTHIPFTGAGPAVVALLGGQIDTVSSGPATVLQHIKAAALDAKVKETISNAGSPIQYLDAAKFDKYVQQDARNMVDVVRRIGKLE